MGKSKMRLSARASKRKHEVESVTFSEPKPKHVSKEIESKQKVDKYCWLCHTEANEKKCVTCQKSFHESCLNKASMSFSELGVCPECLCLSVNGTELKSSKFLTHEKLKKMLDVLTRRSFEKKREKNSKFLAWPEEHRDNLFKIIDFGILLDNINQFSTYTKPVEFYADVKFIYHNSCISFGIHSEQAKAADSLRKDVEKELLDLEACPECYYYMYCDDFQNTFVRLCDSPHDIVWAQLTGHPYWPAKCLNVLKGTVGYVAHVRFFGKHEQSDLPISKCLFLSESHPKDKNSPKSLLYKAAKEELLEYIRLYRSKYGHFPFHPHKTPYKPKEKSEVPVLSTEGSCNRHLVEMKREANIHEVSEEYSVNARVEDSEGNMTFQNLVPNDIPDIPISHGCEPEGQYPTIAEIAPSLPTSEDNINNISLTYQQNLSAVTSINMTFATDETNFENINPVVTSIASLPPTDISSSVQSSPNTSVLVDNTTNVTSIQSNSLPNIESDFLTDASSQNESDDEVHYIGQKKVQGDYNPDVVLPMLMRANPQLKDLVEQTRYFSDAMIVQLYANFGRNGTEKMSKLYDDLKKCELDLKNAVETIEKLRKENEAQKFEMNENLIKAEADIRELESQIETQRVEHIKQQDNARLVIDTMQTRIVKSISQKMNAKHSSIMKENEDLITKKDEIITNLEVENKRLKKELEDSRIVNQRAEDELKTVKKQISPDTLSEYKRMHYCCVCERSAGKTCCLNTSYCSDECERRHAEEHRKHCSKIKSQTFVQQRVVSQQSVVMMSSHGVITQERSTVKKPSHSVFETISAVGSTHDKKPQIHHVSASPLLPTPHYSSPSSSSGPSSSPGPSSSSRPYSSKHRKRSCR